MEAATTKTLPLGKFITHDSHQVAASAECSMLRLTCQYGLKLQVLGRQHLQSWWSTHVIGLRCSQGLEGVARMQQDAGRCPLGFRQSKQHILK